MAYLSGSSELMLVGGEAGLGLQRQGHRSSQQAVLEAPRHPSVFCSGKVTDSESFVKTYF